MGSNIGNMLDERANAFLKALSMTMNAGDKLLLGVDLKKASAIVLPAYNDKQGITAKFNLNLLHRINCELDGNFDLIAFLDSDDIAVALCPTYENFFVYALQTGAKLKKINIKKPFFIPLIGEESIDIDTMYDFEMAQILYKQKFNSK